MCQIRNWQYWTGQSEYNDHLERREAARNEKNLDKQNEKYLLFTTDLQSLLLCPKSNVSIVYYKMKLSAHNFTVYNLQSRDGYFYLWNQTESGIFANEFAVIYNFVDRGLLPLPEGKDKIILYNG